MPTDSIRAITHASELYTCEGITAKDGKRCVPGDEGLIEDGALIYAKRKVLWVGPTSKIPQRYRKKLSSGRTRNLQNRNAVLPGLIDCHTHLIFAGNRAGEFFKRASGATYQEIAKGGGGILSTVRATRSASEWDLLSLASDRLREAYRFGVRTIEIKSGYGLDPKTEKKCLVVAKKLRELFPEMTISATYLGAHAVPDGKQKDEYLSQLLNEDLPKIARLKLARHCDVFLDEGYYSREDAEKLLRKAMELGMRIKLHGDELSDQASAKLACEMGADSVDHLLNVNEVGIRYLGESTETTAVLLPITAHTLKKPHAPGRKLLEAGARVAIATDFNPGTSACNNLPLAMHFAALHYGMSRAELLASVTYNAARALSFHKSKGALLPGRDADHFVLPFATFEEAIYRMGWIPAT